MASIHHRGTEKDPGLVLALDAAEGAFCDGLALRAMPGSEEETLAYLRERELISSAYLETRQQVDFRGGGAHSDVLTYVINRDHWQYRGDLTLAEQAQIIAGAVGGRGPNDAYLYNTTAHLAELGIGDADLEALTAHVREINAT